MHQSNIQKRKPQRQVKKNMTGSITELIQEQPTKISTIRVTQAGSTRITQEEENARKSQRHEVESNTRI